MSTKSLPFLVLSLLAALVALGFLLHALASPPPAVTPRGAPASTSPEPERLPSNTTDRPSAAPPRLERETPASTLETGASSSVRELTCTFVSALDPATVVPGVVVRQHGAVLATADDAGRCWLPSSVADLRPAADTDDTALVASADGYATAELDVSAARGGLHELVFALDPAAEIAGHVRWASGDPVPAGCHVLAWSDDHVLNASGIERLVAGAIAARAHAARTDETGAFRIASLSARLSYHVLAFGCGLISTSEPSPIVQPSREPLELVASGLYGVLVEIRGPRDEHLPTSPRLLGFGPSWDASLDTAESLYASQSKAALLQLCDPPIARAARASRRNTWESTLLLFVRPGGTEGDIGPIDFGVTVPGYEPVHASLTLSWLGRSLATHTLTPLARTSCFGACDVRATPGALPKGSMRGTLQLRTTPELPPWTVAVDLADPATWRVDGVPCGTYDVRFQSYDSYARWPRVGAPGVNVEIRAGERAVVAVDMAHTGALDLELVDDHGHTYGGTWRVSIEQGPAERYTGIEASLGPDRRVVGMMDPGEYRIRVDTLSAAYEVLSPASTVRVERGTTASLMIPIRRRGP